MIILALLLISRLLKGRTRTATLTDDMFDPVQCLKIDETTVNWWHYVVMIFYF